MTLTFAYAMLIASIFSDIGAAADYCERAMFAFDRALMPGFSLNGTCRLDFDRVENRPLFLALHREVTYVQLTRRACYIYAHHAACLILLQPSCKARFVANSIWLRQDSALA